MGIKNGALREGSDEVFGGYLYFHKAPNAKESYMKRRSVLLQALHMYDCARANKARCPLAWEARVPFPRIKIPRRGDAYQPTDKMCGNAQDGKHAARVLRVLSASKRGVASERAVLDGVATAD